MSQGQLAPIPPVKHDDKLQVAVQMHVKYTLPFSNGKLVLETALRMAVLDGHLINNSWQVVQSPTLG